MKSKIIFGITIAVLIWLLGNTMNELDKLKESIAMLNCNQALILRQLEESENNITKVNKEVTTMKTNMKNVDNWIIKYSKKYKVDPKLVESILIVESGKNVNAKTNGSAIGIAQIKQSTAEGMGIKNINNPENNIHASVKYLSYLHDKFDGDETKIISAYNAGPNAGQKFGKIPNKSYVNKVKTVKSKL